MVKIVGTAYFVGGFLALCGIILIGLRAFEVPAPSPIVPLFTGVGLMIIARQLLRPLVRRVGSH
jgi:hypothetical protein